MGSLFRMRVLDMRLSTKYYTGDADNRTIMKQRLSDNQLITSNNSMWVRTVSIERATKGDELSVNLISQEWGMH